ncbi:hypothetical protein MPSEU_000572500 [Mayamaea pseudoterrestris]|nr:hypothetical protein MPSEU_000572500 [Mayamaea pseudoterrestris]
MEMTLSLFAWLGVILMQVMVHYYMTTRKKMTLEERAPPLEASPLVLESLAQLDRSQHGDGTACTNADDFNYKDGSLSTAKTESIQSLDSFDDYESSQHDAAAVNWTDDLSIDGDEPRMFFVLLSQTGTEMMKVSP